MRAARWIPRRGASLARLLLGGLALVVALAACQPSLTPPPPSPKPRHYRPTAAQPLASADPAAMGVPHREDSPAPSRAATAGVGLEAAALRMDPVVPPPPGPPYDPARPCFSAAQMARARAVLFAEEPGAVGDRWLDALNQAFHGLGIPCGERDFLVLALTTIQLESGVAVDPSLENPDLEALFVFQHASLRRQNPIAARLLDYSGLDDAMRAKLRADTRAGHVRTERELVRYVEEDLRQWLQAYLRAHYYLPAGMAAYAAEQGLPSPVRTIGPMQVNLQKAYLNARARGEKVRSEAQMRSWLLESETALERGIKEGVFQLWRSYRYYRRILPAGEAVRYATADYNAGEFSSRNAAFQAQVSRLAGRQLVLDGDLLAYQSGQPAERVSNTEAAVITLLESYAAPRVRQDLLLEKSAAFSATRTARGVCERFRRKTAQPCPAAILPTGAVNSVARIKLGRDYTPGNYARAYVRRWEQNLARFGQG